MSESTRVAERVDSIRGRIRIACDNAQRDPGEITLIGASKRQPDERILAAWKAGIRNFGENQVQEAIAKMSRLPSELTWHQIGPLQSNKVRKIVPHVEAVHSVDRIKIGRALDREAARIGRQLQGFLEVNLGLEDSKHGFNPDELASSAEPLAELESLRIVGLMAIPPVEAEPAARRAWFGRLRELRDALFARAEWSSRPGYLSMGMSADFNLAIEEGATHVRIGTALFGPRASRSP